MSSHFHVSLSINFYYFFLFFFLFKKNSVISCSSLVRSIAIMSFYFHILCLLYLFICRLLLIIKAIISLQHLMIMFSLTFVASFTNAKNKLTKCLFTMDGVIKTHTHTQHKICAPKSMLKEI